MKKEKDLVKKSLIIFSVLLAISFFSMVVSATTLNSPVTGGNYSGTMSISVTVTGGLPGNATNVTCLYNATGGATGTYLTQILNTSAGQLTFTGTPSISALSDLRTYNFSCTVSNSTTVNTTLYANSITVDNTAPTVTISTDQSTGYQKDYVGLNWSCTDATSGVNTKSVTLTANGDAGCTIDGTTSWSTATGSQALSGTQTQCAGLYTNTLTCADYSGNSNTATSTFNIYYPAGGSAFIPDSDQVINPVTKGTTSKTKIILTISGIVAGLIIVILLSFFAISQTKRRR